MTRPVSIRKAVPRAAERPRIPTRRRASHVRPRGLPNTRYRRLLRRSSVSRSTVTSIHSRMHTDTTLSCRKFSSPAVSVRVRDTSALRGKSRSVFFTFSAWNFPALLSMKMDRVGILAAFSWMVSRYPGYDAR